MFHVEHSRIVLYQEAAVKYFHSMSHFSGFGEYPVEHSYMRIQAADE